MTIEEIKMHIEKELEELRPRKDDNFEYKYIRGNIEAYTNCLRLLNDWNGK